MRQILEALIGMLAIMLIMYIPFAFLIAELNPIEWHITLRGLYVISIAAIVTFAVKQQIKK